MSTTLDWLFSPPPENYIIAIFIAHLSSLMGLEAVYIGLLSRHWPIVLVQLLQKKPLNYFLASFLAHSESTAPFPVGTTDGADAGEKEY